MIDEDFLYKLDAICRTPYPDGIAIEKGDVSVERTPTRIFFDRSDSEQDLMLNADQGLTTTIFNVEVASLAVDSAIPSGDAVVQPLTKTLKDVLNGFRGAFGSNFADTSYHSVSLGMFVSDHADDYQPRGVDADDGYFVAAFQVKIVHL